MKGLNEAFLGVTVSGMYEPDRFETKCCKQLYRVCFRIIIALTTFQIPVMLYMLVAQTDSMDDLAAISLWFITGLNSVVKCFNIITKRGDIDRLRRMLTDKMCLKQDAAEARRCLHYDRLSRRMTLGGILLASFTGVCLIAWSQFFANRQDFPTMLRRWYPFEIDDRSATFYCIYLHQAISCMFACLWSSAADSLAGALMIQVTAQFELLAHRLQLLPTVGKAVIQILEDTKRQEARIVKNTVKHHLHIISMAKQLNVSFKQSISWQFVSCSFILGLTIYRLIAHNSSANQSILMLIFLSAMIFELWFYCWFGNELMLKSKQFSEVIFNIDMSTLQLSTRKDLLFIMTNNSKPIFIKSGHFITLTNAAFLNILKLSYSMLNVLRRSS